jgi:hypothetical protein
MEKEPQVPESTKFMEHMNKVTLQYSEGAITAPEAAINIIHHVLSVFNMDAIWIENTALLAYYDETARCKVCSGFLGDHGCVTIGCPGA